MKSVRASIIVSTFDRPSALIATLVSLGRQTCLNFELIVADDGSEEHTAAAVDSFRALSIVPVKHVWQPDKGFRLAAIRNRAIEGAEGDYLIITDGDCVFLPDAVERHLQLAERNWFVSGKRSYLRKKLTHKILLDPWRFPPASRFYWFVQALGNRCTRPLQFLDFPDHPWRKNRATEWRKVQACNLGVWKDDAIAVGGFDERYAAHGLEDSDFIVRLLRHGIRRKRGDFSIPALHLEHPRPRDGPSPNWSLFEELLASDRVQAVVGIGLPSQ